MHSGRKLKATGFVYLKGSTYRDAEGSSQLISCLHDAIINYAPRMVGGVEKLELYQQCPPRRLRDTHMTKLEKCKCVSSVTTITPIMKLEREKWVL